MITVNELTTLQCHKAAILEPLAVVLSPFAPHVAEELWHHLGHTTTIVDAPYPTYEERFVVDNTKVYPVAINGKPRAEMEFALDMDEAALKAAVLTNDTILKYTEGKEPKKFIYVKGKMINIVI
jgi:leucyl-tRNA synthetase